MQIKASRPAKNHLAYVAELGSHDLRRDTLGLADVEVTLILGKLSMVPARRSNNVFSSTHSQKSDADARGLGQESDRRGGSAGGVFFFLVLYVLINTRGTQT